MNTTRGKHTHKSQRRRTYKKTACSPLVNKSNKVAQDSCLTKSIMLRLKKDFNKNHPDNPILFTKPILIWRELKSRIGECIDDRCLLQEIDDHSLRNQIIQNYFAPEHPPSWLKNRREWLSNFDIDSVMKQYMLKYKDFVHLGTTSIDYNFVYADGQCVENNLCKLDLAKLIKSGKRRMSTVFNLSPHNKPGSHWVSVFVDVPHRTIMYFNSSKNDIPKEVQQLSNTIIEQGKAMTPPINFVFKTNERNHQNGNTECGVYSIYFIVEMLRDFNVIGKFIKGSIPDRAMEEKRYELFNAPVSESVDK